MRGARRHVTGYCLGGGPGEVGMRERRRFRPRHNHAASEVPCTLSRRIWQEILVPVVVFGS